MSDLLSELQKFPFELGKVLLKLELAKAESTRVMLVSPAIRFSVAGKPFTFTFFANAREVVQAMESAK